MKHQHKSKLRIAIFISMALAFCLATGAFLPVSGMFTVQAQAAEPAIDDSPALYVAQKNINSVVGVITNDQTWDRRSGVGQEMIAQGSGVVIREGGYILTNNHVIAAGSSWEVLLPSGDKVEAELVGADSATDLAVLKVPQEQAAQLIPVTVGGIGSIQAGSTAVAIGNPGGTILANSVTQGIVSALERDVNASSPRVSYIQHDAAINSGSSGGGLFNYKGELVGINTLKYSGNMFSSVVFEGTGFAIPIDTVEKVANELIENGKVRRPAMGVTVREFIDGPDEPMPKFPPKSVVVLDVREGSPAETAGIQKYDFIYEIDGVRVTNLRELTVELDKHSVGDTVEVKVVRYNNLASMGIAEPNEAEEPIPFGNSSELSTFEYVTMKVELASLD